MPTPTRTFRLGFIVLAIGCALVLLPLILPHSSVNRFLVVIGFLGICWSLSVLINALWDVLRGRS